MKKILREPVFQFALLGILLFGYFNLVDERKPVAEQSQQIVISDTDLQQLIERHKSVWRRPPSETELTALIDGAVREEVLVREALALGLDRGDTAIRNRLSQKMQFLTDSVAQMLEPSDDILRAYMAENPDSFTRPAAMSFDQVYLGDRVGQDVVDETLAQLAGGASPNSLGRGGLLPVSMPLATEQQVDNSFGTGFFAALSGAGSGAKPGEWVGPVRSGYGVHLVRVGTYRPAAPADFAAVREKLLFDWRRAQGETLAAAQYDVLRDRYEVVTPDAAALQQALAQ